MVGALSYNPPPTGWVAFGGQNITIASGGPTAGFDLLGHNDAQLYADTIDNASAGVKSNHDPNNLSGLESASLIGGKRSNYSIYKGFNYAVWPNAGYNFDMANGFRVMMLTTANQKTNQYIMIGQLANGYSYNGSVRTGLLGDRIFQYLTVDDFDDRLDWYHIAGGVQTNVLGNWHPPTRRGYNRYWYTGFEFPAGGVGNITYRFVCAGDGSYTKQESYPCPNFGSTVFDSIYVRAAINLYASDYSHHIGGIWYGTLNDAWPI